VKAAVHPASIQQNEPEQGEAPSNTVDDGRGVSVDDSGRKGSIAEHRRTP
jgi:hypothetical protein